MREVAVEKGDESDEEDAKTTTQTRLVKFASKISVEKSMLLLKSLL